MREARLTKVIMNSCMCQPSGRGMDPRSFLPDPCQVLPPAFRSHLHSPSSEVIDRMINHSLSSRAPAASHQPPLFFPLLILSTRYSPSCSSFLLVSSSYLVLQSLDRHSSFDGLFVVCRRSLSSEHISCLPQTGTYTRGRTHRVATPSIYLLG